MAQDLRVISQENTVKSIKKAVLKNSNGTSKDKGYDTLVKTRTSM